MKMKQIEAANMKEAMRIAREELGEDAVLLESNNTRSGIVVTFAIDEEEPLGFDDIPFTAPYEMTPEPYAPRMARPASARAEIDHPAFIIARDVVTHHNLPDALHEQLIRALVGADYVAGALNDVAEHALADALVRTLTYKTIATGQALPPDRAIMLVGMHGAGKTSALAKLATELTLQKKPVVIISADNERMGAADTLAGLCGLLKCQFHIAEDRAALKPLLREYLGRAWLLVDSTGVNIYEFQQLKALGELAGLTGVEPILTCPAGMDAGEAQEMASVLSFLGIERMVATKVDATRRLGSLFTAVHAGGLALANMSNSAKPTETCTPATAPALARLMMRHVRERTA